MGNTLRQCFLLDDSADGFDNIVRGAQSFAGPGE